MLNLSNIKYQSEYNQSSPINCPLKLIILMIYVGKQVHLGISQLNFELSILDLNIEMEIIILSLTQDLH